MQNLVLVEGELAIALDTGKLYIGTASGNVLLNPDGGTAETATKLATPRTFQVTGDASSAAMSFDGTQNVELQVALAAISGLTAGTYTKVTVDAKGRVTAGNTLVVSDLPDNIPTSKITGTWLQTTAVTGYSAKAAKIAIIDSSGWIYYRTPQQILEDIEAAPMYEYGTEDLVAGQSSLETGKIYLVYE